MLGLGLLALGYVFLTNQQAQVPLHTNLFVAVPQRGPTPLLIPALSKVHLDRLLVEYQTDEDVAHHRSRHLDLSAQEESDVDVLLNAPVVGIATSQGVFNAIPLGKAFDTTARPPRFRVAVRYVGIRTGEELVDTEQVTPAVDDQPVAVRPAGGPEFFYGTVTIPETGGDSTAEARFFLGSPVEVVQDGEVEFKGRGVYHWRGRNVAFLFDYWDMVAAHSMIVHKQRLTFGKPGSTNLTPVTGLGYPLQVDVDLRGANPRIRLDIEIRGKEATLSKVAMTQIHGKGGLCQRLIVEADF